MTAPRPRSLALALAPGTLLAGFAGGIVFPIIPIVGLEVGLSLPLIGVILAANRAMRVVSSPAIGVMADRLGFRRTMLIGLALHLVVMAAYAVGVVTHHEGAWFLVGRLVHGLASACVFVAAQALALAGAPERGGQDAGLVRASMVLGVPLGLAIGGVLADAVGYVWTFALAGGAVAAALVTAAFAVPDLRRASAPRGSILGALATLRDRRMLAIGGLNFALRFSAGGMILGTLALLVASRHLSVLGRDAQGSAGLLMGLMVVVDAALTPLAGRLGDRRGAHAHVAAGSLALIAAALVGIALAGGTAGIAVAVAVVGVGAAGLGPSVLVLLGAIVPSDRRGAGAGVLQLCGDVGGMLGPLVGTALFAGSTGVPYLLTAALVAAFVPVALWLARALPAA